MPRKCLWAACLLWLWLDASRERLPGTAVHPKPNNLLESRLNQKHPFPDSVPSTALPASARPQEVQERS